MKIKIQNHLELKFSIFYWTHSRSQQPRSDTIYYCSSTILLPLYYVSTTTVITIIIIIILLYGRYDSPIFHQNSFLVHCLLLVTGVDCVNIAWFTRTHTKNERKREGAREKRKEKKRKTNPVMGIFAAFDFHFHIATHTKVVSAETQPMPVAECARLFGVFGHLTHRYIRTHTRSLYIFVCTRGRT